MTKEVTITPNISADYNLVIFYKKHYGKKDSIIDNDLRFNISLSQNDNVLLNQTFEKIKNDNPTLKGSENFLAKVFLNKDTKYTVKTEIISPSKTDVEDVDLTLSLNSQTFAAIFKKTGYIELMAYICWVMSFVFFMLWVINPWDQQGQKQAA